ncbi:hypothetical protein ACWDYH_19515 [Nocardia goodfellowii]
MRIQPTALGYLRHDISGISQAWDEIQIRSLAKRLGYDLAKTVAFGARTDRPVARLIEAAETADMDAVLVPSAAHFEDAEIPVELVRVCDVITVSPEANYARWATADIFSDPAQSGLSTATPERS